MAQQQAALAQQAAAQQQAAVNMTGARFIPVATAQGYFPPSQYPAFQYPQAPAGNVQQAAFAQPVAAAVPTAPPIMSNAQMPHAYRGVCTECHQVINAGTTNPVQPVANQMMWNNNMAQDQNSVRAGVGNGVLR